MPSYSVYGPLRQPAVGANIELIVGARARSSGVLSRDGSNPALAPPWPRVESTHCSRPLRFASRS